jgi:isocitrate dehydrogenase kinase/phosphatase
MTTLDHSLAASAAEIILTAYESYTRRFQEMARDARGHFERVDWHAVQRDSAERLDLYTSAVRQALDRLLPLLGEDQQRRTVWTGLRAAYAACIDGRGDGELAETFFNSITRRVFHTIGVDPSVEFIVSASAVEGYSAPWSLSVTFTRGDSTPALIRDVLEHFRFAVDYEDLSLDVANVTRSIEARLGGGRLRAIELARSVFYRGKGAYLVGKLHTDGPDAPFLLALTNPSGRIVVDAALLTENEVSIVFSFARSYFFTEMDRPREMVDFLRSIMPRKPIAELYNAIGCNKHGKSELYRSLLHYLASSDDQFEIAAGQRGMVMCVFTLPGFDIVFKVIRDRFDYPKTVTHQEVRDKYRLVFHHDRAGRLVDAQEFEHLEFDRRRFSEPLLRELTALASETVKVHGDTVVIGHLYTERRLRPLDVYLREADADAAQDAVTDYGQVLRDLAATNIFPGDMLLKNFGVSRHGRLIFYDYDELCRLTDCRFRTLPTARDDSEETAQEPWFYVGERDIFPEEFRSFLGLKGNLLQAFLAAHEELLGVEFWNRMQDFHRRGDVLDVMPYRASRRFRPES